MQKQINEDKRDETVWVKRKKKRVDGNDGRPRVVIDWVQVQMYARAGCSGPEVAAAVGLTTDYFYKRVQIEKKMRWSEFAERFDELGKAELRLAQHKKAVEKLNTIMLIWMGKQRLNQYDRAALNVTQNDICLENLTIEQLKALQTNPALDLKTLNHIIAKETFNNDEIIDDAELAAALSDSA